MNYPPVKEKPIVIVFSHGATTLKLPNKDAECIFTPYTIPENVDIAYFTEPGEWLSGYESAVGDFCVNPDARNMILEPCFLWHSTSDVTPSAAHYTYYYDTPIQTLPFTQKQLSPFELTKRAKGGSLVDNLELSFQTRSFDSRAGLYIHTPDGSIDKINPSAFATAPKFDSTLEDVISYLQGFILPTSSGSYSFKDQGFNLVLLNCHVFHVYKEGIGTAKLPVGLLYKEPRLAESCQAIESLWHDASTQYMTYDLYDKRKLLEEYPTLEFPVFAKVEYLTYTPTVLAPPGEELLSLVNQNLSVKNLLNAKAAGVNTSELEGWYKAREGFLKEMLLHHAPKTGVRSYEKQVLNYYNTKYPRPTLPHIAFVEAREKAMRNNTTRKAKEAANTEKEQTKRAKAKARLNKHFGKTLKKKTRRYSRK